jgi:hypothetical protein
MPKSKSRKKKSPKRVLALPDLEQAKTAVLNSLTSVWNPREDIAVRLDVDQAPRARPRRVIRRGFVQWEPEESADRQRVRRPPGNPSFRIDAFKVAEQQQPKVPTGRESGPPHDRRIEPAALPFDERVESVGVEQRI